MTVGSMSLSLTRMGSKQDLIKLISYVALLKPDTGKISQKRHRIFEDQIIDFFVSARNELRHKFRYHSRLDSCQTSRSLIDYDVG